MATNECSYPHALLTHGRELLILWPCLTNSWPHNSVFPTFRGITRFPRMVTPGHSGGQEQEQAEEQELELETQAQIQDPAVKESPDTSHSRVGVPLSC